MRKRGRRQKKSPLFLAEEIIEAMKLAYGMAQYFIPKAPCNE